jgi:hypothetical protein
MTRFNAKSITFAVGLCAGAAALTLIIGLSGRHARAAEPPPIELKQPACTCSSSALSAGRTMHNCQCGVLQCVVVDSTNVAATPSMVCSK